MTAACTGKKKQMLFHYLVNTLVASIDQSVSKGKPPLCISIIYLKAFTKEQFNKIQ